MAYDNHTYLSPFTWRYGSQAMRRIWSEVNKRILMRRVWVALAKAQHRAGLVSLDQMQDLEKHQEDIDIGRAREIEKDVRHDVVAEIRTYAEQCSVGGSIIHWGLTSADVTDNVDALRMRDALRLTIEHLEKLLAVLADRIEELAGLPVMGYTHIQPAEPTTLGYRFAVYGQDLLQDLTALQGQEVGIQGKGLKGAVGTQAAFEEMLVGTGVSAVEMEAEAMAFLELPYFPIATQVYSRKQDFQILNVLADLGASLHKFAMDFRIMQSPAFGELSEPFGKSQTGSSAMPFKQNPIISENICSLTRYIAGLPAVAWDNASQSILERTLDDSANRRIILPEAFLAIEQCLMQAEGLITGMTVDKDAVQRNLDRFGQISALERVFTALVSAGADRQNAHQWLRDASIAAGDSTMGDQASPLKERLLSNKDIAGYLSEEQIEALLSSDSYTGTAETRALDLVKRIRYRIGSHSPG